MSLANNTNNIILKIIELRHWVPFKYQDFWMFSETECRMAIEIKSICIREFMQYVFYTTNPQKFKRLYILPLLVNVASWNDLLDIIAVTANVIHCKPKLQVIVPCIYKSNISFCQTILKNDFNSSPIMYFWSRDMHSRILLLSVFSLWECVHSKT